MHDHGALGVSSQSKYLAGASSSLSGDIVDGESDASRDGRNVLCTRIVRDRVCGSSGSTKAFVNDEPAKRCSDLPRNIRAKSRRQRFASKTQAFLAGAGKEDELQSRAGSLTSLDVSRGSYS